VKYTTRQAFECALSDRLKRQAAEEGVDLDRLRKRVAFERFLAGPCGRALCRWVLKGGDALEPRELIFVSPTPLPRGSTR
jgi:hypothetical protein